MGTTLLNVILRAVVICVIPEIILTGGRSNFKVISQQFPNQTTGVPDYWT